MLAPNTWVGLFFTIAVPASPRLGSPITPSQKSEQFQLTTHSLQLTASPSISAWKKGQFSGTELFYGVFIIGRVPCFAAVDTQPLSQSVPN